MTETQIQSKIIKEYKRRGYYVVRCRSMSPNGLPDLLVKKPGEPATWIEVKRPGEKPRPLQAERHRELRRAGYVVLVLDKI